ncbi:amidohydrolase family protein [Nocardia sp. NBC_01327]|uniref:amidohydrolase family protein n=1 Tax=Nocardia sp. NBC_01327 TaxID=2903593 RepID=UPI002E11D039|nr:amidohydrolase [Nocardia sp. NBC_01327]
MRIDFHSHYLPPRFFERMDALQASDRIESYAVFGPRLAAAADRQFASGPAAFLEHRLQDMENGEVDLTMLSVGAVQPYFESAPAAIAATRLANELLHEAVAAGHGRFGAFGSLPLPHTAAALDELAFCFDDCGFQGVNLGCSAAGSPLDAPEFDDIWAALNDRAAMVFLHPGATPQMAVGSAEHLLAPAFCGPTEMAIAVCRLVAAKIPLRFPRIQVIAGITGGSIPYLANRWDRGLRMSDPALHEEIGGVLPSLRRFWFDTSLIEDDHLYDTVRATIGVDRLVFGSDTPRGPVMEAVDAVLRSDRLSEQEKHRILDHSGDLVLGATTGRFARPNP